MQRLTPLLLLSLAACAGPMTLDEICTDQGEVCSEGDDKMEGWDEHCLSMVDDLEAAYAQVGCEESYQEWALCVGEAYSELETTEEKCSGSTAEWKFQECSALLESCSG